MKTLIIIDTQNDFMPGGALAVPEGNQVVPIINRLMPTFDLVIATQDWHPGNHKSFASQHQEYEPFDKMTWHGKEQVLWPDHCVQGSLGAAFHSNLNLNPVAAVFRKGMDREIDSYSGFYDNDHKNSTGLAGFLKEMKVAELFFCGLAADFCVLYSIKDALEAGFKATLIEDATRAMEPNKFTDLKSEMAALGCSFISSSDDL
jgi:nicotinamidase/pyrazinamidase